MTNIVPFPAKDNDNLFYETSTDAWGGVSIDGVALIPQEGLWKHISLSSTSDGYILASSNKVSYSRKELAEFLWAAAYYIDSGQQYCPEELVGQDYENC